MLVDSEKYRGRVIAIAALFINILALFGLSRLPSGFGKFFLLTVGATASGIGLVGCEQYRRRSILQRDSDIVSREARIVRLENDLIPEPLDALAKPKSLPLIKPAPPDWLKNTVVKAFHIRINGQTGSGKSTLTDNAIALAMASLGEQTKVVLIDPKYPLSDWDIEPQYKGINEALSGLQSLANTVENRLKAARKCKDTKGELPDFSPILYVVDEIDWIASEYEKDAIKLLKIGLKVGRALNIKVIYIGQTPLCSDLKLRRNDFNHSSNIFLGENALAAIEKEACYSRQEKAELRAEYSERIAQKQHYLGLVKEPSKRAYFAILPPPKAYQDVFKKKQDSQSAHLHNPPAHQILFFLHAKMMCNC